jgi:nitrite reductase/ring-hydroxylating ferredoxin subunit/uncharacterized membrane protein
LEKAVERIEAAQVLDGVASLGAKTLRAVIKPGVVQDTLSGTAIGHPAHPLLVTVPIGAWTAAPVLDALGEQTAARRMTALGCAAALPAAVTGASDWLSTKGAARRVGFVHSLTNYTALGLNLASWRARARGRHGTGVALSLAGAGALVVSGWLGGHLTYALGVGVDTTVFQDLPTDWTAVAAEADLAPEGQASCGSAGGVPILLVRRDGGIAALADRCSHRGGALHEGTVDGGCIVCPLHGSTFALEDGAVVSGPATRPQPMLETRVRDGQVEVRRIR